VSLILDALKKLERNKEAREPNVLVVGSVPWGTAARSRRPLAAAAIAVGLVALVALAFWLRHRPAAPATAAPSPAAFSPAPPATGATPAAPARPKVAPGADALTAPEPRLPSLPPATPDAPKDRAAEDARAAGEAAARRSPPGTEELRLNAISQRDGRPVALINDRLLFEGDGFDGVRVLHIGESEVEVEVRGVKRVLRF
jgi:type IV secretory pathway VirB10-like protein